MSNSGFTGPPPVTPPTAADARPSRTDVLKVVDTVGMIRNNARMQRLGGEIVAENKDGTLRIATTEGDITVQKPANRPDLTVGAKVEIDVPAGRPPRQITLRETQPPPQQPQTQTPTPPPVIATPPRAPVNIPEQPRTPPPQTPPAPVTAEQIIRLLPLPPAQATQIVQPPADVLDIILPALPPAIVIAAPETLSAELIRALITTPSPQIAAQQIANVIVPQLPPSAYVTPAPLPGGLPPAVQTVAEQLLQTLLGLNVPSQSSAPATVPTSTPPAALTPAALIKFIPAAATPAATSPFSLLPARLPPAMAAFAALAPENLIQSGITPPVATGAVMPKMDVQILSIATPTVNIGAPGAPIMPSAASSNPLMPQTASMFPQPPDVPAGMLSAQVRGMTPQNFPVLSVAFPALNTVQDFVMQFPAADLVTGAPVTVQQQPGALVPVTTIMPAFTPLPELMTPGLWPALDDAFQALQAAAPQAAHMLAQTSIPSPAAAPRMPAIIMMFVAAMQGGDLQNWLGEKTIDSLRRIGKADIVSRIARDGAAISRLAAAETAPAQEWRSLPVPMMWDNHVHKIMLHYRNDREASKDSENKKTGTRFILDITPPRMGSVQLDGLHRPGQQNGKLDLIVRTKENLSPSMQQAMRRLYVHALEQAQLSGELSFQGKKDQFIQITGLANLQ